MKKNKGFTLVELLVSMALLSFVIILSAILFDRAIQGAPALKATIKNQSDTMSNIEKSILMVKEIYRYYEIPESSRKPEEKPKDFDLVIGDTSKVGEPISLDLGNEIAILDSSGTERARTSKAKGYLISASDAGISKIKYNNASKNDKLVTFVSVGHKLSETSSIEKLYVENTNRFMYFSKNSPNLNIRFYYEVADKNKDNFERMRLRFLKSPHSSNKDIYSVYNEGYFNNPSTATLTQDLFDYYEEKDSKNSSGTVSYIIDSYSSNVKKYLDSIDRNYAATAVTFNINARVGNVNTTFNNNKKDKNNSIYLIGLPKSNNLIAHYDTNLLLSQSILEKNIYYSLFDIENKEKTSFKDNLQTLDANNYIFSWNNMDVRDFLGIGNKISQEITVPDGFLNKISILNAEGNKVDLPNYRKPYGDTLYYNMDEISNSIKLNSPNDYTFFVKYNPLNYNQEFNSLNSSETHTYSILSHNVDLKTGMQLDPTKPGFTLYVNKDGTLGLHSFVKRGTQMVSEYRDLGYNMNNSGLYTNSNDYKFDGLTYDGKINDKRDGRKDFNIICIAKDSTGFDVFILGRDMGIDNIKTKTYITRIQLDGVDYSGDFYFGSNIERLVDLKTNNATEYFDPTKQPVMEISDVIVYGEKFLWNNSSNDIATTMNYLYRKYLTNNERGETGKFDQNIIGSY